MMHDPWQPPHAQNVGPNDMGTGTFTSGSVRAIRTDEDQGDGFIAWTENGTVWTGCLTMSDQHRYELDVTLTAPDGTKETISREYASPTADTVRKAASEVFEAIKPDTRARMSAVNDSD